MTNPKRTSRTDDRGPGRRWWLTREVQVLGLLAAVIAAAMVVFTFLVNPEAEPQPVVAKGVETPSASRLIRDDSPQEGPVDARVTLVEFLDPECEACGAMFPIVERIRVEYAGKIRFVVRYFPLHRNSVLAAKAMEAAGRQGRYWEMYSLVFQNQGVWGEKAQPQTEIFMGFGRSLGLDMVAFERDLNDSILDRKIQLDQSDGRTLGVEGTPTFFLNGSLLGSMMT
jgi:protein-disulfide isomerase